MNKIKQEQYLKKFAKDSKESGIDIESDGFKEVLATLHERLAQEEFNQEYFKEEKENEREQMMTGIKNILEDSNDSLSERLQEIFDKLTIPTPEVNVNVPEPKQPIVNVSVPDVIVPPIEIPEIKVPEVVVSVPEIKVNEITELPKHDSIEIEYNSDDLPSKAIYKLNGKIVLTTKMQYNKKGNVVAIQKNE
jgi:hypothetical protein